MKRKSIALPEYWQEHLDEKIKEIKRLKSKASEGVTSFALITDFHWRVNEKHSAEMLRRVLSECEVPYFFSAGDIVSGAGHCTKNFIEREIRSFLNKFKAIEDKGLYVEGNHDRAFCTFKPPLYYKENMPRAEFDNLYFARQRAYPDRIFGGYGYYYLDEEKTKTRFIVLNSQDVPSDEVTEEGFAKYNAMRNFGFLQEQIDWFAGTALSVPCGWGVVICTHADDYGASGEENSYNYELMLGVLDAFLRGGEFSGETKHENPLFDAKISVDYKGARGDFALWVSGHIHRDRVNFKSGIPFVTTATDAAYVTLKPERQGTVSEQAFDVFVIDRKNRRINTVRIGAGEDREIRLEELRA